MFVGRGKRSSNEAKVIDSVGANLYRSKFKESIVERVLEYGKVESLAVYYRVVEGNDSHTRISETYAVGSICTRNSSHCIGFFAKRLGSDSVLRHSLIFT